MSLIELGVCPFSSIAWPVSSQALSASLFRCASHISVYTGIRDSNSSLLTFPASTLPDSSPQFHSESFSAKNLLTLELVYLSFSVQIFWFPYMLLAIVPGKSMNQLRKTWSYFIDPNHCHLVLCMDLLYLPFLGRLCYLFSFLKETQSHGLRSPSVYFLPSSAYSQGTQEVPPCFSTNSAENTCFFCVHSLLPNVPGNMIDGEF